MRNMRIAALIAFSFVFVGCSDPASRDIAGPDAGAPLFNEVPDGGIGLTAEGPFDGVAASEDPSAQQAATGGRATGHVAFDFSPPFLGVVVSEKYSFTALSIDPPPPFAAKGQYELQLTTPTSANKVHGEVVCLRIVGNTARIGGRITKLWINNVQVPTTLFNLWTVQDNGEGEGPSDLASLMRFTNEATARSHCAVGFALEQLPPNEGNIQVSSR